MKALIRFCLTLMLLCLVSAARADTIREIRSLDFGAFAITAAAPQTIVMGPTGAESTPQGGIHKMKTGHNATFQITHIGAGTQFYITIDPVTITHLSGSPSFNIDTFTFNPANDIGTPITADGAGSATVDIGATLHIIPATSYTAGVYRGNYNFMINF